MIAYPKFQVEIEAVVLDFQFYHVCKYCLLRVYSDSMSELLIDLEG